MTGIDLLIVIGGCYAIYTVAAAISAHLDYRESMLKYRDEYDS